MAEAEDVITDIARHATVYAQALWRRHRATSVQAPVLTLAEVAPRIELLMTAVFGTPYRLRTAQAPAPATFLAQTFQRGDRPRVTSAIPATDGVCIWLPPDAGMADPVLALDRLRTVAMQQAMRASRGAAALLSEQTASPLVCGVYLLIEAHAADHALARQLPGIAASLNGLRRAALAARPPLASFPQARQPLERLVRTLLQCDCDGTVAALPVPLSACPQESADLACQLAAKLVPDPHVARQLGAHPLFKDWWTGEFRAPNAAENATASGEDHPHGQEATAPPRSARLTRRPEVRAGGDDEEDDVRQGAWMVQTAQPQEHAEDPFGLQRPTDRDEQTAAEEFAQSLSELAQARLVSTPGQPKEVLLSDDPPDARSKRIAAAGAQQEVVLTYPEWDYRINAYLHPGASISLFEAPLGPQSWVDQALAEHRAMLALIGRRFEMLRAHRTRLRKQLDGDELDLEACIESRADWRAGLPMAQAVYQTHRRSRRDMAIMLLIDVSGSTDGWVSANRRVIDVEREALLLVCIALAGMGAPYAVQAFSGQGPNAVVVKAIKRFEEPYSNDVAQRISALEPEHYTRVGAAIRHASATLMREPAAHRLLLLLSDGKPNDVDRYEGRYGVEDTRQAVTEAKLQGIFPFCLTVDRNAASYLPAVFGAGQYALLTKPQLLPIVLLDWMKRLLTR
jgi:nitric oxide reductase NorD protein